MNSDRRREKRKKKRQNAIQRQGEKKKKLVLTIPIVPQREETISTTDRERKRSRDLRRTIGRGGDE